MFKDEVGFQDGLSAGLTKEVVAPTFPCIKCGKETAPHHDITDEEGEVIEKRRICMTCRNVVRVDN